jgi:hypothetical protein
VAITARTPTTGTAASGAGFTVTLPASTAVGDMLVVAVSSVSATAVATPTGWTSGGSFSAGTSQGLTVFAARYTAALTLSFTNAAGVSVWICNAFYESAGTGLIYLDGNPIGASNSSNNTTVPTGAPVATGNVAGDYEVLVYSWTSSGTITFAANTTKDSANIANGSSVAGAMGHANATLGANATATAWSATLSGNNQRKVGVGWLLMSVPTPTTFAGFVDAFNDGSLDPMWAPFTNGGTVSETSSLSITPPATANQYAGIVNNNAYDLTGRMAFVWYQRLNAVTGVVATFQMQIDGSNYIEIGQVDALLVARRCVTGTVTTLNSLAWPQAQGFYLRMHESGGATYWMYSTDNRATWTLLARGPNPITMTALKPCLIVGTYQTVGSPGTALYNNLNYVSYKNLTGSASGLATTAQDSYRRVILADNPVAWYRLEENLPNHPHGDMTTMDSGPNNRVDYYNKGDPTNGTYETFDLGPGALAEGGRFVRFNGSVGNSFAYLKNMPEAASGGPFTVETWLRAAAWPAVDAPIISMGDTVATDRFLHCVVRNGLPYFGFYGDDYAPTGSALSLNVWHHLAFVYEGAGTKMQRIYVDGVQWGTGRAATGTPNFTGPGRIGQQTSYNLNGDLDELAFYGTALSQAQISAHVAAASLTPPRLTVKRSLSPVYGVSTLLPSRGRAGVGGIPYSSVVMADAPWLWWRLGETSGSTVFDSSGNNRNGTISGAVTPSAGVLPFDADGGQTVTATAAYIQGPMPPFFTGGQTWTVEFWLDASKYWQPGAGHAFFACGDANATDQFLSCAVNNICPEMDFYNDSTTNGTPLVWPGLHHLVYSYDGSTRRQYIFVDGVQIDNHVANANLNVVNGSLTGNGFRFGSGETASYYNAAWPGKIDELAIYTTLFNAAKALAHYNAGWGSSPSPGMTRRRGVTAASFGVAIVTSTLGKQPHLVGTANGVATVGVQVSAKRLLGGSASGATTTSGVISRGFINALPSSGSSTVSGQVTRRRALTALSTGLATVSVQVSRRRSLVAASIGTTSVAASLTAYRSILASATATATVSGAVSARRSLGGSATGTSSATAQPSRARYLTPVGSFGAATVLGIVSFFSPGKIPASAAVGQTTTSGTISAYRALDGSSTGTATDVGQVALRRSIVAGPCHGLAITSGTIQRKKPITGALSNGRATATGQLTRLHNFTGISNGAGHATGFVQRTRVLVGLASGSSSATGLLRRAKPLVGTAAGKTVANGDLTVKLARQQVYWSNLTMQFVLKPRAGFYEVTWEPNTPPDGDGEGVFELGEAVPT